MDSRLRGNGTQVRSRLLRRFSRRSRVVSNEDDKQDRCMQTTNNASDLQLICNARGPGRCLSAVPQWPVALFEATCVVCCCGGGLKGHSPHPEVCVLAARRARVSPTWAQPASVGSVIPDGVLPALFCPWRISFIFRNESRSSCDDSSRDEVS